MSETLRARIRSGGPKRILSLDGGGIRGLITLGYLERIEAVLKANYAELGLYQKPARPEDFRLRDYFDMIGGTSTGAIIASGLAIGMSVSELIDTYLDLGNVIFGKQSWLGGISAGVLAPKFDAKPLQKVLDRVLGDRSLGDSSITTGLCLIAKRYETNSVWLVTNAPDNMFYADGREPNSAFPLAALVRASTAAPTYFEPEVVRIGTKQFGHRYGFIDGGVSPHNNPALKLFMAATFPNYGFGWPVGADRISLISIGTGDWRRTHKLKSYLGAPPLTQVPGIIDMFMEDCSALNETVLQAIGSGQNRRDLDMLTGRLSGANWGPSLLCYERFQIFMDEKFFDANGLGAFKKRIKSYKQMDNVKYIQDLLEMGRIVAKETVRPEMLV